jgi:Family of unknown function (DUF5309)
MATPTNLYASYNLRGNAEEVDDQIYNLDPEKTPFASQLSEAKTEVRQPEWQEDYYDAANKDNARLEGDEFAGTVVTPTVMMRNHIQTFTKDIVTSGIANAIKKYGRGSEQDYQMKKKGIEIRTDIEAAMLSANPAVASTNVAASKMAGLELWATSTPQHGVGGSTAAIANASLPTVAPTDGTLRPFTEAILTAGLRAGWENGLDPKVCYLTMLQKSAVNNFAGIATRRVDVERKGMAPIIGVVDVYVWETGPLAFVNVYADRMRNRTLFITDGECLSRLRVRPISRKQMGVTGDNTKEMLVTDVTLKCKNRQGLLKIADLS